MNNQSGGHTLAFTLLWTVQNLVDYLILTFFQLPEYFRLPYLLPDHHTEALCWLFIIRLWTSFSVYRETIQSNQGGIAVGRWSSCILSVGSNANTSLPSRIFSLCVKCGAVSKCSELRIPKCYRFRRLGGSYATYSNFVTLMSPVTDIATRHSRNWFQHRHSKLRDVV